MSFTATKISAPVLEVFASFQGEGLYVGQPQVFLRLAGCPMRCTWCDTPHSWEIREGGRARIRRAGEEPERVDPWASPFKVAVQIASVEPGEPRPVSITGGEPLIWPEFIRTLQPMLGGRPVHLETAGGHPEALARVLDRVAHVSLDLKPPFDMDETVEIDTRGVLEARPTTERAPRNADEWRIARRRSLDLVKDVGACVKIVVRGRTSPRAYDELFEDVARRAPALPVFLTPVTPVREVEAPSADHLVEVAEHARDLELDVRVLPQVHRAMGIA